MNKSIIILVGRDGKEKFQLDSIHQSKLWIIHDGRRWKFGVGLKNGKIFYYEVEEKQV